MVPACVLYGKTGVEKEMRLTEREFAQLQLGGRAKAGKADERMRGKATTAADQKLPESQIQSMIIQMLRQFGWFVVKIHQSLGSYKGIADLYALKDGRNIWIEVKTPRGRLSKHQERFRDDVGAHGGEFIVARGIDDIEFLLKR